MGNANSSASSSRAPRELRELRETGDSHATRPSKDAILRTLERLSAEASAGKPSPSSPSGAGVNGGSVRRRAASGVYRFVDEYAGLERLDRAELDETDDG